MSTVSNYEALRGPDEQAASLNSAEIFDIQEWHDRSAALGEVALNEAVLTLENNTNREHDDWRLVQEAKADPDSDSFEQLLKKYDWLINLTAKNYFIAGGSTDDLLQVARIGLYKAVRDYNYNEGTSFRTFARVCVYRNVVTAVKDATRHKHMLLNNALSFSHTPAGYDDGGDFTFGDALPNTGPAVEDEVIGNEVYDGLLAVISNQLSPLERSAVEMQIVGGRTYDEMAVLLETDEKGIDSALQRAKLKIQVFLKRYDNGDQISDYERPKEGKPPQDDKMPANEEFTLEDFVMAYKSLDLTMLESVVVKLCIEGKSNRTSAQELDKDITVINNTLKRVMRKIVEYRNGS